MPSFSCDGCQDVMRKAKLDQHAQRCRNFYGYSCVDCSAQFNKQSEWKLHTSCITEEQKYHGKFAKQPKQQAAATPPKPNPQTPQKTPPKQTPATPSQFSSSADSTPAAAPNPKKRKFEPKEDSEENNAKKQKTENKSEKKEDKKQREKSEKSEKKQEKTEKSKDKSEKSEKSKEKSEKSKKEEKKEEKKEKEKSDKSKEKKKEKGKSEKEEQTEKSEKSGKSKKQEKKEEKKEKKDGKKEGKKEEKKGEKGGDEKEDGKYEIFSGEVWNKILKEQLSKHPKSKGIKQNRLQKIVVRELMEDTSAIKQFLNNEFLRHLNGNPIGIEIDGELVSLKGKNKK